MFFLRFSLVLFFQFLLTFVSFLCSASQNLTHVSLHMLYEIASIGFLGPQSLHCELVEGRRFLFSLSCNMARAQEMPVQTVPGILLHHPN